MKKRESIFTSYFPTSLYKFVLMILAACLLSSCALMGRIGNKWGLGAYDDYSTKPLEYDQQYKDLLNAVTHKSKEKPNFQKLAEKESELQKARKDYEKCKAELTEAENGLNEREKMRKRAQEDVDTTKNALDKAMQTADVAKQNELKQQVKQLEAALSKAKDEYNKASDESKKLEVALRAAVGHVAELQWEFDELKPERQGFVDRKCWDGFPLNPDEKTLCAYQRNLLIGNLIAISDGMCEKHMKTILGNEAAVNIITGTFTNVFAGAATVTTGAIGKSILAALAFFSNSERSLVNETIYKSVLVPAIIKKINEIRLNERREIMAKYDTNKNAAYEDYPVNFALADIIKYHQSCSFMVGLQKALEEGTQTAPGQDRASLEQKLKALVLEKDIRKLELDKQGIRSEGDIKKDKYIIYLDGQIDAITNKLSLPEAKKPEDKSGKLNGTIKSVDEKAKNIVVTGTDGKAESTFVVDEKTKITKDTTNLTFADLNAGMSVNVEYKKEGDKMIATAIKVSEANKPPPVTPKSGQCNGIIKSADAVTNSIVVVEKNTNKTFTFLVDEKKIKITKDTTNLTFADLKAEMSVNVEYKMEGDKMMATAIEVSAPKAAPPKTGTKVNGALP